jgi:hypothetical protein
MEVSWKQVISFKTFRHVKRRLFFLIISGNRDGCGINRQNDIKNPGFLELFPAGKH